MSTPSSEPVSGRFTNTSPVEGIEQVDGWELLSIDCRDGDRFSYREFIARGPDCDVCLDVSRFEFAPTQERFAWFVRAGFPDRPETGPWDNIDIDGRIAAADLLRQHMAEAAE